MKLGYTIVYVPDVAASLSFFENAFGLTRRFLHESGDYGELDTGPTTLAFASLALGHTNLPEGFVAASDSQRPLGMEIALVTDTVAAAHAEALGGELASAPVETGSVTAELPRLRSDKPVVQAAAADDPPF